MHRDSIVLLRSGRVSLICCTAVRWRWMLKRVSTSVGHGHQDSTGTIWKISYQFQKVSKSWLSDSFFGLFLVISQVRSYSEISDFQNLSVLGWKLEVFGLWFRPFLKIGAITSLDTTPAGVAQQCKKCDIILYSSSEVFPLSGINQLSSFWKVP